MSPDENFNKVKSFEHFDVFSDVCEEFTGQNRFYAFVLKQSYDIKQEFLFIQFGFFGREVQSYIFIDPHSTFAVFVDEDHFIADVK